LIDWFTVAAQALNFIILLWLLKRLLYKPILDAIEAREKRIAAQLADAAAKSSAALAQRDEFLGKNAEFERQRTLLLQQASAAADAERQRLLEAARQAADALTARREEALRTDLTNLRQTLAQRTQQEVFAITRRALQDLATSTLEERMVDVLVRRLQALDTAAREQLLQSIQHGSQPVLVRSAFELPAAERSRVQAALNELLSASIALRFETRPELVSGIELTASGQKIAWSIAEYLRSLEGCVSELLTSPLDKAGAPSPPLTP